MKLILILVFIEYFMSRRPQKNKFVLHWTKQRKGNAVYIYHMIAWYYREDNKPKHDIIKHLGKLNKEEIEYYSKSVACLNKEPGMSPCEINNVAVKFSKEYLPCAVGIYFWNYWKLSEVFKERENKKEVQTSEIAQILTVIRLIQNSSKSFSTYLYKDTCLKELLGIEYESYNKTRVFRELENIEACREKLGTSIFDLAKKNGLTKGNLLFYDLSSSNISGLKCVMAKWGHCKDGFNTHVVLLLVITPEGYPVYWDILKGNTAEAKTICALIEKIEGRFGKIESVLCFDRGMVSDENLKFLENKEISYITALDGNQLDYFDKFIDFDTIEKVKKLNFEEDGPEIRKQLSEIDFIFAKENLYYQEIELSETQKKEIENVTNKLNLEKRRYFLAFNPEMAHYNQKHRKERVEAFFEWVKEYNQELSQALSDREQEIVEKTIKKELKKRKIANVKINYTITKKQVENKNKKGQIKMASTFKIESGALKEEAYEEAKKYDGLWMLITNIKKQEDVVFFKKADFKSYFEIYRLKNRIEEAFRILSDFVGVEPFYVYKEKHIKAHFTICVLSYLLDITILNKIRQTADLPNLDLHNIFYELKKCKQNTIQLSEFAEVKNITQATQEQKKILEVLNCLHLIEPRHLAERNIITVNT